MSKSIYCSCITCKKKFSVNGLWNHFASKHTEEGIIKAKQAAKQGLISKNGITNHQTKCSCILCKSILSIVNINKHFNSKSCKKGGIKPLFNKIYNIESLNCEFCKKKFTTSNALKNHILRCKENPNHIKINNFQNRTGYKHSEQTKLKISLAGKNRPKECIEKIRQANLGKKHTDVTKQKLRQSMALAVKNNPESYSAGNQGRVKTYTIDGVKLKGKWEVDFYKWCKNNNIRIDRPKQGFYYYFNGHRTYFPDFYLPDYNQYIEVKGYQTKKDDAKWLYFPFKLNILKAQEIQAIRNNTFNL